MRGRIGIGALLLSLACGLAVSALGASGAGGERSRTTVEVPGKGEYFLTIRATLPDQLGLKPLGYEVYRNGERVEEEEGHRWSRNYIPFFTVDRERGKDGVYPMHFVRPLELEEEDELTLRYPRGQDVVSAKLHRAIDGIDASVGFEHPHHVYFSDEEAIADVTVKGMSGETLQGRLIVQHVRLADNQGQSSWNPGYRTTEVARIRELAIDAKLGREGAFRKELKLPTGTHRLVGLTLLLNDGGKRWAKYLGAASVVPKRNMSRYHDDGRFISSIRVRADSEGHEANAYKRFGIDWVRFGWHWDKWESDPGEVDWARSDKVFDIFRDNKLRVLHLVGPVPKWARATEGDLKDVPYKGRTIKYDWAPAKEMLPRFGRAHRKLYERYSDVIRASNIWNEPWEGIGITGWKSTGDHYRAIVREIRDAVEAVDPSIKLVMADSAHNTQWKLFAAGMEDAVDVISTHYANPTATHAYSLARYYGTETWETETWRAWAGDASSVRHALLYFANRGDKVSLFNHQMFFDHRGNPTPGTVWVGAMRHMLEGVSFQKVIHPERPPFVFLFAGEERAVAAVTTSAFSGTGDPEGAFRTQFGESVLSMDFDAPEGARAYDILGNPIAGAHKRGRMRLEVSKEPRYIAYEGDPSKLARRIEEARYKHLRPAEIKLNDINRRAGEPGAYVPVTLKNAYPDTLEGRIDVEAKGLVLKGAERAFELKGAQERELRFRVAKRTRDGNRFPVRVTVESDRGTATLEEPVHFALITRGAPKVDGDVKDWKGLNAEAVRFGMEQEADYSQEAAWRPWEELSSETDSAAESAFAADEDYLYFRARVKDSSRDILPSMLSGENLHELQNPPADHMYVEAGPTPGGSGDYIQLAFADGERDPFAPRFEVRHPDHPLHRLGSIQRSEYVYMLYPTQDGGAEIMRMRTPNFYYLHPLPIDYKRLANRCHVEGAEIEVKRVQDGYVYEAALPWSELTTLEHAVGQKIRLNVKVSGAGTMYWSAGRSAARVSATDFEPTWGSDWTTDMYWGFVD